ncbi:MAG: NAD(P)-binding domain-containing protein [Elusimicrobia bacterium]|nr:NAD(P)-binding domain-containing protein [Elusimicrobiota bacterium]
MAIALLPTVKAQIDAILQSGDMPSRRPVLKPHYESNVKNMYIIGDLAGAPVIKLAMEQGYNLIQHIASLPDAKSGQPDVFDVLIAGAGASGLNAALEAKEKGLSHLVLEKGKIANTIENFPEKKWVYAEPDSKLPKGKLWLDGAQKEDLITRWHQIVTENQLNVRTEEGVLAMAKAADGLFQVKTPKATYRAKRVILAIGQRGNPRKLKVPGEDRERVYHRLYSPRHYRDEDIVVIGGGNSAIEAALVLAEQNRVVLSYRGDQFARIFKDNERRLNEATASGRIRTILNSNVKEFKERTYRLEVTQTDGTKKVEELPYQHAFVLIGADLPVAFLKSLGIKLENEWEGSLWKAVGLTLFALLGLSVFGPDVRMQPLVSLIPRWLGGLAALGALTGLITMGSRGNRYAWLGVSFLVWYTVYGVKVGKGQEFWPFKGWGYAALSFFNRPWSFWYTVMYTSLMTIFGVQAMKRWGFDRKDKFQIWRYVSLLSFQWIFFFLIPEFLFQWAVKYQWIGASLAKDPQFAGQAWRSYGVIYAWPLFFYTFFYDPHKIWILWGVILTFVLIPIFAFFHGKRYCSWICGCGGLAETFGDRWRHLSPKGKPSLKWEQMNLWILIAAVVITVLMLGKDVVGAFRQPAQWSLHGYRIMVDVWLVGILPVTLYPFLGGKVWCRYWCPLAKLMALYSQWFGKFKITANDKCIACNECSRNCQVGIDVMSFALKQNELSNKNSSCIGCGICVSVCPMDVLGFGQQTQPMQPLLRV